MNFIADLYRYEEVKGWVWKPRWLPARQSRIQLLPPNLAVHMRAVNIGITHKGLDLMELVETAM